MAAGRARQRDAQQLEAWRRTRWLGTLLANLNRAPDTDPYELTDLLPLPGDPEPEPPRVLTPEEQAAEQALLDELDADLVAPK